MTTARATRSVFQELSDLFASDPSRDQILDFRPSKGLQRRARTLLVRNNKGTLTYQQEQELNEFIHAEMFMTLLKAKLRAQTGPSR
jgi:hypothetical protein